MKRIIAALAGLFALALPSAALAQCSGIFAAGSFCGNSAAIGGLAGTATPTAMFDRAFGGTNNSTIVRLSGVWTVLSSANNGVWITSAAGVPSISSTLPNAVQDNITRLGTIVNIGAPLGAAFGGTGLSALGAGIPAWLGTPSSANLRAALTDETGTGLAYFQGGDIGTPSAGVLTNATGLPIGGGTINTLALNRGGTGQTTAPLARASSALNIDAITTHGDSIYTILSTDRVVATSAAFTASRTWTLPAANSVNAGQLLVVTDLAGGVTASNTLVISRVGADTINGGTSVTINAANNAFYLISDGSSKWTAQSQSAVPGTGTVTNINCAGTAITSTGNCIGTLVNVQFFFTPGTPTYTRGANVTHALGACVGAGGGGGGTTNPSASQVIVSSSGGGGGFAMDYIAPSSTETITIPAGGAGGGAGSNPGTAGGSASIGTKVVATGGSGGGSSGSAAVETASGTLGGAVAGMTGSVKIAGGNAGVGWGSFTLGLNVGGHGGSGSGWFGGAGAQGNTAATGAGSAATGIGGGGGGANSFNGGGIQAGGNGFQGGCMIMEFM